MGSTKKVYNLSGSCCFGPCTYGKQQRYQSLVQHQHTQGHAPQITKCQPVDNPKQPTGFPTHKMAATTCVHTLSTNAIHVASWHRHPDPHEFSHTSYKERRPTHALAARTQLPLLHRMQSQCAGRQRQATPTPLAQQWGLPNYAMY